jgi:hypothetical protein
MVNMNMMGYFPMQYIENLDHTVKGHREVLVDRFEVEELAFASYNNFGMDLQFVLLYNCRLDYD